MWRQHANLWAKRMLKEVHQKGETSLVMQEEHDQSFDAARIKYINLNSIKSVLFTKLESSTGQRPKYHIKLTLGQMAISCHSKYSNVYFQRQQ